MNKDLGNSGLLIISFIMSPVLILFLPVYIAWIVVLVAFIMAVLALMRFSKEKNAKGIISSIVVLILQIGLVTSFWLIQKQESEVSREITNMKIEQWKQESQESEARMQKLLEEANIKN